MSTYIQKKQQKVKNRNMQSYQEFQASDHMQPYETVVIDNGGTPLVIEQVHERL